MNIYLILILYILYFSFVSVDNIHLFQLNSYRYRRYFRWLVPNNILSYDRLVGIILLAAALLLNDIMNIAVLALFFIAKAIIKKRKKSTQKTPLVFTNRVKRLYATTLIVYIASAVTTALLVPQAATIVGATMILLSDLVMLIANIINTPIEKGINRYYYNDAKKIISSHKGLIIIGVTGSFGKTSTKNYLASLLAEKYNVLVTPGNFNTLLGVVRTIREQLRPYHQVFIVEMGAKQQGDIKEICDLVHPTIGIVTAVGEMHLETFKSVENIQKTKFELINSLPANGLGVVNTESQLARDFNGITSKCKVATYSIEQPSETKAQNVEYGANGIAFTLSTNSERYESRLLGTGNLLNMLAAIIVSEHLNVPIQKQKSAIARLQPVEHRLSMRRNNGITILDDAYNSNPQGAKMALEVLKNFSIGDGNKRIVITPGFVEMGSRQYEANRELGGDIARCCDYAIVVNETNRKAIACGIEENGFPNDKLFLAASLNEAHAHLATIIKAGDVVLYENDLPDNFK